MEALVELRTQRAVLKDYEVAKEKREVIIKSFMQEFEVLVDAFGVPLVSWKQAAGAKRLDGERLKLEMPAVAAQYTKIGEPSRRFLVK